MAEPLHRSSDVPSFDTYPSGPELAQEHDRLLPEHTQSSPLQGYGAQLGSAAGHAVLAFRRARQRVRALGGGKKASVTDIATARLEQVRDQAAARGERWGRMVRERALEWRRQARNGIYRSRLRAREIAKEQPAQVVIGAGIIGVVVGAGLRLWRANRA